MLKRLYVINFSSQISPLYTVVKGQTYPAHDFRIHGEHDGEKFSPVHQSVCMLQPF